MLSGKILDTVGDLVQVQKITLHLLRHESSQNAYLHKLDSPSSSCYIQDYNHPGSARNISVCGKFKELAFNSSELYS